MMKLPQSFKRALAALGVSRLSHEPASFVRTTASNGNQRTKNLSWWQLELALRCQRCFWLAKRHGVRLPQTFPPALHLALDGLLKAEFDAYRKRRILHPVFKETISAARLFRDTDTLRHWRNPSHGLRWKDPTTGYTLHTTIHDLLEFPNGALVEVYPSYQLQLVVATFLLLLLGYL
jgi:hypothetical protein